MTPFSRDPIVAIDGPAGAGKSTVARLVAEALGFQKLDTGAIYRAVALASRDQGVDWADGPALGKLAAGLRIEFAKASRTIVDGRDVTDAIRTPAISQGASAVSKHPEVRAALLGLQRAIGQRGGIVAEGRDVGTVVFPDAEVKIFLTASPEVRARRRFEELRQKGEPVDYETTLAETIARDHQDSTRAVAPLVRAPDGIEIDSSALSPDEVAARIVALVHGVAA